MKTNTQSGIYKITNIINNKIYVGSAKNINKRWKRHVYELNNHTHHNIILQNSWDKHGSTNFVLNIIELVTDLNDLLKLEQKYINELKPFGNKGYNIAKITSGGDILTNNPKRTQIIEKISDSMKIMWSNKTDEEKKIIGSKITGENNPSWNGGSSVKYCKCGTKIATVNTSCRNCLDYTGKNNPFYGKSHTEEYKTASSIKRKGTYHGAQNKPVLIDGVGYTSIGNAELALGIKKLTIRYRINSTNFTNYTYL